MYKAKIRTVQFFQIKLSCKAGRVHGLPPNKLVYLMSDVEKLADDDLYRDNRTQTATIYLKNIKIAPDKSEAILLINCSDRLAADTVLTKPRDKARREVRKRTGEGQDYSSHIIFRLKPVKGDPDSYDVAIESAPTLPIQRVQQHVNYLFRKCTYTFPDRYERSHPDGVKDKNGKDKKISVINHVELRAIPSEEMIADLNNGQLSNIELITDRLKKTVWDDGNYAVEEKRIVCVKPELTNFLGKKYDLIKSICGMGNKKKYELIKINFKLANGKHSRTAYLNTIDASPIDERYIKREFINFEIPLPTSCDEINDEVVGRMRKLM